MFDHWLIPSALPDTTYAAWQLGANIIRNHQKTPAITAGALAIIGIDAKVADAVRSQLFKLGWHFGNTPIIDVGNTRRADKDFVAPILTELMRSGVIPMMIGGDPMQIVTQHLAYQTNSDPINSAIADRAVIYSPNEPLPDSYLYAMLAFKQAHLAQCSVIGFQTHLSVQAGTKYLDEQGFDSFRLGRLRDNLEMIEPILRDADMMAINLNVVRAADVPAVNNPTAVGLTAEESMRLCRYAGLGNRIRSFGVYGLEPENDPQHLTAQTAAQMIWYFCDGFRNRIADHPSLSDQLNEYVVPFMRDYKISFWKSLRSNRWWMQLPDTPSKKQAANILIACSYQDFQQASNDEMPERLVNALKRQG